MGFFYVVIVLVLFIYAVWMFFFPLVICNKMDKIIKILEKEVK